VRKGFESFAQLVNVPNSSAVDAPRTWHATFFYQHPKFACRYANCRGGFELAQAKYDWQKWQYVDSSGQTLHVDSGARGQQVWLLPFSGKTEKR
jgi:hypothetical protein